MIKKSNKQMVFFLSSLHGGGAERVMLNLAGEIKRRGEDLTLLVASSDNGEHELPENIKNATIFFNASRTIKSLPSLVRYLRKEKPDVLFTTLEQGNFVAVLAKYISWSNVRVIIRVANTLSFSLKGSSFFRRIVRLYGARLLYPLADEVIVNSVGSADNLAKTAWLDRSKIKVIQNPTITPSVIEKYKQPVTHEWIVKKRVPVILAVGRLHIQKDYSTLLKAFARLLTERDARLIILGEGEERKNLETLVKELGVQEYVDMPGFVENPYAFMSKVDLFVLSSRWEGAPNTLIEAIGAGTPVVSTDCPSGPREILENGRYGELVPVGNVTKLATALSDTLAASKNNHAGQAHVRERYSVERVADMYLELTG